MNFCILMINTSDAIYLLNNWKDSKDANVEKAYSELIGKKIIYQE